MSTETKWLTQDSRQSLDVTDVLSSNLLITGSAGAGKTVAVRSLIRAYIERGWLVRSVNLSGHPDWPLRLSSTEQAEGPISGAEMLLAAATQVGGRKLKLERSIRAYQIAPDFAPLLIVVDELASLLEPDSAVENPEMRDSIVRHLAEFANLDLRLRVRLVVTSQRSNAWAKLTADQKVKPEMSTLKLECHRLDGDLLPPAYEATWSQAGVWGGSGKVKVPFVLTVNR